MIFPLVAVLLTQKPNQPLLDKTLVVWVKPANVTQRGGSALTIDDGRDHFDGIVFGELVPQRWMAGSDFYRRSNLLQDSIQLESRYDKTAANKGFIQIAITYQGKTVTIYRNGVINDSYIYRTEQQPFGIASRINIGLRHPAAQDNAHFAGAIDDARIYAQALTPDQITSLKPNKQSVIKPWAWWNFENGSAKDLMGRFRFPELKNQAKIVDGALILDGISGEFTASTGITVPVEYETPTRPKTVPANWLTFHLAHPGPGEAMPGDPNCAFFWHGRYHLHYIYNSGNGFAFAHVSSTDMVHWRWHRTTLMPLTTGHGMFSGTGFYTKEGRPAIIYHGQGSGRNQISVALDDNLDKWSKPTPLIPTIKPGQDASRIANWDPDAWIDSGNYYALSGGIPGSGKPATLFRSSNLKNWDYLGDFLTHDMPGVQPTEDISCPNFFRIGNRWMLLCISHTLGCRYYLGDWKAEKFTPDFHARMNWHGWDFFAPESVLTPDGRRVMWAWCNFGTPQTGIQSLPRELSLPADGVLRIKPLRELESLRTEPRHEILLNAVSGQPVMLRTIQGDALELQVRFSPTAAKEFGLQVHCDAAGNSGLPITVVPGEHVLRVGNVIAPFDLKPGEPLSLRVFIDKNVVEVFANDRQAVVASHVAAKGSDRIQLIGLGDDAKVDVRAWRMRSIY